MDEERTRLYTAYQSSIHKSESDSLSAAYLCEDGGIPGGELHARDTTGRLLAVSVVDYFPDALSSVYCYYDPKEKTRGLGTFMVLSEIAWCLKQRYPWLYLGFYVAGSPKMAYKSRFVPHQILYDGVWKTVAKPPQSTCVSSDVCSR
jgi:arginine-tRNA-protein transferase